MLLQQLLLPVLVPLAVVTSSVLCGAQALPHTSGETLSGRHAVLADELRGHASIVVAGFSREAGDKCGAWAKAIQADAAMAKATVYQIAMLEGAPALLRGMIKSGMKKGVPAAEQDRFVVLTQDEKQWRQYFGVTDDKDPYVGLLDSSCKVLWRGHGQAAQLEPQLRGALK